MTLLSALEIFATILGFIYLYLEYKAKYALWIVGLIWSLAYMFMFWKQGMIAWVITWGYYFIANIYGMIVWKKEKQAESPPTHLKGKWLLPIFLIITILMYPLWILEMKYNPLAEFTWIIFGTVFSTAIGFVGMYLLAKKIVEQWIIWIVVNLIYTVINFYTGYLSNEPTHYLTATFFFFYTFMAVLGYFNWKKMASVKDNFKSIH